MRAISWHPTDITLDGNAAAEIPLRKGFTTALIFAIYTYEIILSYWSDPNILSFMHTTLVFIHYISHYPLAMSYLENRLPWELIATVLNTFLASYDFVPKMDGRFPGLEKYELPRPLPEDYAMRGLIYAEGYHPDRWFINENIEEDEKYRECASMR